MCDLCVFSININVYKLADKSKYYTEMKVSVLIDCLLHSLCPHVTFYFFSIGCCFPIFVPSQNWK